MCSISQNDEFCPRRLGSGRLWKIATVGPITTQGVASWVRLDFCRSSEHLTDELSIPEGTVAQIEAHESCSSAPSFFQQCRSHTICYRICPSASGHLEKTKKIKIKVKNIAKVYYSFKFAYTECPLRERSDLSQASSPPLDLLRPAVAHVHSLLEPFRSVRKATFSLPISQNQKFNIEYIIPCKLSSATAFFEKIYFRLIVQYIFACTVPYMV